jgi:hypothetical protein
MKFTGNGIDCSLESKENPATPITIQAITAGKPTTLTIAGDEPPVLAAGDMVTFSATGSATLDGKAYLVSSVELVPAPPPPQSDVGYSGVDTLAAGDTYTVTIGAADTTGETLTGGTMTVIMGDVFCLKSLERQVPAAQAIDVTTFCGAESLAGQAVPGNLKLKGFVDYASDAYNEFRRAVTDGQRRWLRLTLPNGIGTIIMQITATGFTETFEANAAAAFDGEAVINAEPLYIIGA